MNTRRTTRAERQIKQLLKTPRGAAMVGEALTQLIRDEKKVAKANRRVQGLVDRDGMRVNGDDLVHPKYGRVVGAAKTMRENGGREPLVS